MSLWSELRYLVSRLDRRRAERDLEEEMRAHLEHEIDDNLAAGMAPDEARDAARRKLGNLTLHREDARAVWTLRVVESTWQDLRHATRVLRARPGTTLAAVVSLALGIGVCTAVFSVVDGVVLRPLPYPDADRIVALREVSARGAHMPIAEPNYKDLAARSQAFAALGEYMTATASVSGGTAPARARVVVATHDYLRVFGVEPARGRAFGAGELAPVCVVSHAFWQRVLGGRAELGSVRIDEEPHEVIGVMPPGFAPDGGDLFVARERSPADQSRTAHNWNVVGRLDDGVGLARARADVSAIARGLASELGSGTDATDLALIPLQQYIVGDRGRALWILLGAVGLLLLIALANVANLMLAQATSRRKELALRAALGASRPRLLRQLVSEALLLALLGAALGMPLAVAGVDVLLGLDRAALPRTAEIHVDARALLFTLGVSIVVALALAVVTALRASAVDLQAAVKESGRGAPVSPQAARLRKALVVAQVALAFTLLVGAGLVGRSFARLMAVDPGFKGGTAVVMELAMPSSGSEADEERLRRFHARLLERLGALPGVTAVGAASKMPMSGPGGNGQFLIDGDMARPGEGEYRVASEGYFAAMQIPLLAGRLFGPGDTPESPHVAVISQSLARKVWPGGDAIGKRIQFGNMDGDMRILHVVGIVGDVRERGLDAAARPAVYAYTVQRPQRSALSVVARGGGEPAALGAAMRAAMQELAPEVPVELRTVDQIIAATLDGRRFSLTLLAVFALVALLLALTGIYGVTAYAVAQRTHEIGIRIALGARARTVMAMIIGEGALLALAGVAIGAAGALALTRLIASWLYDVGATDPATFTLVGLALAGTAVAACWLPARRAVRVDPMIALRSE